MIDRQIPPLKLFLSYTHVDDSMLKRIFTFLIPLQREGLISPWFDGHIEAGQEIDAKISSALNESDIILLVVTQDFLASSYCYGKEMTHALARHDIGTARVVPIILRYCDWKGSPFAKLKALPKDGKPVSSWNDPDEALLDMTIEIRKAAETLMMTKSSLQAIDGLKIQFIHHVNLPVRSLSRSLEFYEGILGLKETVSPKRPGFGFAGAWLQIGTHQHLHLVEYQPGTYRKNQAIGFDDTKDCHFAIQVPSFAEALEFLKSKGYKDEKPSGSGDDPNPLQLKVDPHSNPGGYQQIYLTDPDGHIIEIHEYKPQV